MILKIAAGIFAGMLCWNIFKAILMAIANPCDEEAEGCSSSIVSNSAGSKGRIVINGQIIEYDDNGKIVVNGQVLDIKEQHD